MAIVTLKIPHAVLFDLDDTILIEGNRRAILHDVASQLEHLLWPHESAAVADRVETALREFWSSSEQAKAARLGSYRGISQARETVITETLARSGVVGSQEVGALFSDLFTNARSASIQIVDEALTTMSTFRQMGIRLGLVTNGAADIQRRKLERFGLARYFDHVQIEGELGFGKPEERAYFHAMEALGSAPQDTWMIGDNLEWEVAAPQRLGIRGIWHDLDGTGLPTGCSVQPDKIFRKFSELLSF
ncbi:putative Phosphoglycolate phosphatase [Agrobacterium deltaense NCPPB 1641]|uniref:Phosphoglycolate phosphatase n=1 Tax=Agrobacterium deltaense NCPPB 1641 TaxID=1183425 RepID=A0A1S7UC58_9HYPH|nr:putative Phosphoglycolate phosphatase [Agrobacterium deltaense NCPPB 1641]